MKFAVKSIFFLIVLIILPACQNHISNTEVKSESTLSKIDKTETKEKNKVEEKEIATEEVISIDSLANYEMKKLEYEDELYEIEIEYPKFSYAPIDKLLQAVKNKLFEEQKVFETYEEEEEEEDYFLGDYKHRFNSIIREPIVITKDFISIYFEEYMVMGYTGFELGSTFNFNLHNNHMITIDEVLQQHSTTEDTMRELISLELIYGENFEELRYGDASENYIAKVREEMEPGNFDFSFFTLTEESIIFYKQFYSLFSNSDGIVGVELKWSDVEAYMEENALDNQDLESDYDDLYFLSPFEGKIQQELFYTDPDYGFTIEFPESWKGKYSIEVEEGSDMSSIKEVSKTITFSMVEGSKLVGTIFSIRVMEDIPEEEAWSQFEYGPFETLFATHNNNAFTVIPAGGMSAELYEEPYLDLGYALSGMVSDVQEFIVDTVTFE
ncbi:DUF4163 domain-containing protein [Ornithinibacillus gellani]|uniref:hypothetical protein n=1 Tax=Ornithinibacillus gellani TaxID=2293253 RepID=UPI000F4AA43F|nr:hypothetical protein [Ornithinibacillus gellani]TQS70538.1 DUF4163 domain-containing protein [Ornithinibacillus gellani]